MQCINAYLLLMPLLEQHLLIKYAESLGIVSSICMFNCFFIAFKWGVRTLHRTYIFATLQILQCFQSKICTVPNTNIIYNSYVEARQWETVYSNRIYETRAVGTLVCLIYNTNQ